jgi:hypothetical protein
VWLHVEGWEVRDGGRMEPEEAFEDKVKCEGRKVKVVAGLPNHSDRGSH